VEQKKKDTLSVNQRLGTNEELVSNNGKFRAVMQGDGNFVLYVGSKALWSSQTPNSGATYVIVQGDDNVVVYDNNGKPYWATSTNGKCGGAGRLVMQDDGNLVLYNNFSQAAWATNTVYKEKRDHLKVNERLSPNEELFSSNGTYRAVMQGDGNFVVYAGNKALWATATNGTNRYVIVQGDDNVVVYDEWSKPHWASNTNGKGGGACRLVMQDDGNLVLYTQYNQAIWASNTNQNQQQQQQQQFKPFVSQVVSYVVENKQEQSGRDVLHENGKLNHNQEIISSNGHFKAIMQNDGNFVIYKHHKHAIWATNTNGSGADHVILQGDHNLVLYHHQHAKWASNTNGKGSGKVRLVMQNDGNLVLYDGWNQAIWASNTADK